MADHHNRDSRPDSQVTRRNLLAAASAMAAVGAVPAIATAATAEALTIPERFALLPPEDQALVLAEMDRLEAERETPILALFRRHQELTDAADAYKPDDPDVSDEEVDALFYNERDRIEDELLALPCTGPGDFAAKMIVASCRGGIDLNWERHPIWAEARTLTGGAA